MARKKRSLLAALRTPTKDRKRIAADEKVALELSDRERDLIMKHTFAGDELTDRLRILPRPGEPPAYRFTLDELDELAGYVAGWLNVDALVEQASVRPQVPIAVAQRELNRRPAPDRYDRSRASRDGESV